MNMRIDSKSAIIGGVVAVSVCFLVGAARERLPGPIGRFQIDCTSNSSYLVDTVTGQVWHSGDSDFRAPKLTDSPVAAIAADFIGRWRSEGASEDLVLRLEEGGRALGVEGDQEHEGHWQMEGSRISVTIDREPLTGEMMGDGRLILRREDQEDPLRIYFRKIK